MTAELGDDTNSSSVSNTTPPRTVTKAEHDLTTHGEVEDHDFHPSRETSGPRCRKSGKGGNEHCSTGRCPTVDVHINGKEVKALVDTGSKVTTVTERWVQENLQHADLDSRNIEGGKRTGDSIQ